MITNYPFYVSPQYIACINRTLILKGIPGSSEFYFDKLDAGPDSRRGPVISPVNRDPETPETSPGGQRRKRKEDLVPRRSLTGFGRCL